MIDQRLRDGEGILADFVFNARTILTDAVHPNRAAVLEMERCSGRENARDRKKAAKENGLSAHHLEV